MSEYIERKALYKALTTAAVNDKFKSIGTWAKAICVLHDLQAADVAPVVRCKDCKYWQDNNGGYPHEECRWGHGETPKANDFCSYGEQKDGDSDAKEN